MIRLHQNSQCHLPSSWIICAAVLGALVCFPIQQSVYASGRSGGSQTYRTAGTNRILYARGKNIFLGKTRLELIDETQKDRVLLEQWHKALPRSAQQRSTIATMAGKLSLEQRQALHHYLSVRFKVSLSEPS